MTLSPEVIEARKWCIETALERCDDVRQAPGLAFELIALLETGCLLAPVPQATATAALGGHRHDDGPVVFSPAAVAKETAAIDAQLDDTEPLELTDKELAVLDAIRRLSAGGEWPSHAAISDASDVPRGSLGYALNRLLDKGCLTRVDGRWAFAEVAAE